MKNKTIKIKVGNKSASRIILEASKKIKELFGKDRYNITLSSFEKLGKGKNKTIHLKYTIGEKEEIEKNIQTNSRRQKINRKTSKDSKRRRIKNSTKKLIKARN